MSVTNQAWGAVLRPMLHSCLQLGQHGEQILSHCIGNTGTGASRDYMSPRLLSGPARLQVLPRQLSRLGS